MFDSTIFFMCEEHAAHLYNHYEYIEIGAIIHCPTRQWRSGEVLSHCDIRGGCGTQSIFSRSHIVVVIQ